MLHVFKNNLKSILSLAVLLSTSVLFYQNCAQVPEQKGLLSSEEFASQGPFPLDVEPDTYAYMSCSDRPELDKTSYFTVKLGAIFSGSGIFLSQAFQDYLAANNIKASKVKQMLIDNRYSREAKLQVSLRLPSNIKGNPLGTGPYAGRVGVSPWGSLTSTAVVNDLALTTTENKLNIINGKPLVGSFLISNISEGAIVDAISNSGISVIGFQGAFFSDASQKDYRIIAPSDLSGGNLNAVYGRGYVATVGAPTDKNTGGLLNAHNSKVLASLTEKNVVDGSFAPIASWNCKAQAQYRIVPAGHENSAGCGGPWDATGLQGDDLKAYTAAKALLIDSVSSTRWRISQTNRCIVDTLASSSIPAQCYNQNKSIEWGRGVLDVCGGSNNYQCPEYLSICWR